MLAWGMGNAPDKTIFISRAGADKELAIRIAKVLRGAGHEVILQDETFGHQGFLSRMNDALETGARVIALLSPDYLRSDNCAAEWQGAIKGDPLNRKQRLILFRACACRPPALISQIPYVDLMDVREDPVRLATTVLNAVARGAAGPDNAPGTLIDPDAVWEVPSFTGRGEALEELHKALFAEGGMAAVTAVHGTGGMGKSALAREYARRHRQDYSILWWLNAETEDGIIGGLIRLGARFIPGLDREKDRTQAAKLALERVFAPLHKPALLIFDNVEKQELLRKWKPQENCHILVTSRLHGWGGGFHPVEINEWPPEDARDYLMRESARADLKTADADEIAKTLGYLPLALAHTAAVLRDNPAMTAKSYLARIETLLDRAPEGAEYGNAVFATFQEALAQAEKRVPGAAAILCLAAFYAPDDIPFELLEQKPNIYPNDLAPVFDNGTKAASLRAALADPQIREDALSALASLSLIALDLDTRDFSAHRLIQVACRDLTDDSRFKWISVAVRAISASYPNGKFGTWPSCERLSRHAEAVANCAPDSIGPPLSQLLGRLDYYLSQRAQFARAEGASRRALVINEKFYGPDDSNVARSLNNLADLLRETQRTDEAEPLMRRALAIEEKAHGSAQSTAACLVSLGSLLRETHRYEEAEQFIRRALAIDEKIHGPDHPEVATDLNNLAHVLIATDRFVEAEPLLRRGVMIDEKWSAPNDPSLAVGLCNLAGLLLSTNRVAEAAPMAKRAVSIFLGSLGEDHPHTKSAMKVYATILAKLDAQPTP